MKIDEKISQLPIINSADQTTFVPVITGEPPVNRKLSISGLTVDLVNYTPGDGLQASGGTMYIDRPVIQSMIDTVTNPIQTGLTNEINNRISGDVQTLNTSKEYTDVIAEALASGSPNGSYDTLSGITSDYPTGDNHIYLTRDNGNWNYWNSITELWTPGGIYQTPLNVVQSLGDSTIDVVSQDGITKVTDEINLTITQLNEKLGTKIDGAYVEAGLLYLTVEGVVVVGPLEVGSGGGGSVGSILKVINLTSTSIVVASGESITLQYSFSSIDTETSGSTGNGTADYYVNNIKVASNIIQQGNVSFDISSYVTSDSNIRVTITDSYGSTKSINYTVQMVSLTLSSVFDYTQVFTDTITFKYTPYGSVSKTIYFLIDDIVIGTTVTSYSNRQLTYVIPKQLHGSHKLTVYAESEISGVIVRSNVLFYDLICVETGNNTPIITVQYNVTSAEQLTTLNIPYQVYDPLNNISTVTLAVSGSTVSTVNPNRSLQYWNYYAVNEGYLPLSITCRTTVKNINLTINPSSINVEAVTDNLELYLTSIGRSNTELNRNTWVSSGISCTMTGFNFATDGWLTDSNGDTVLTVGGDARVEIPLKIFGTDFRPIGKTIEFEFSTSEVSDYESIIVSCWNNNKGFTITPQLVTFKSEQTTITTQFKEDERVRISFVVEQNYTGSYRLVYTYINGIMSGLAQYPVDDNFKQSSPVNITIGSSGATINIYNIRSYNNDLNRFQILDNYIADLANLEDKVLKYNNNQIFDDYGNIVYSDVLDRIPCMTIIGTLPTYKGDKKVVSIVYENLQDPTRSFTASGCDIDVQGTSSQYYPRKNYKIKFTNGITYTLSGTTSSKYQLRTTSIPEKTYTVKADFAESSSTHNTGMAKYIENSLRTMNYLTPKQTSINYIRTTVDGFPMAMFHKSLSTDNPTFLGKYNFNNDKGNTDTFGFVTGNESWEFLNNTSDICLFKSSDFTSVDDEGTPLFYTDLDIRYPDSRPAPTNLQIVFDWVISCDTTKATGDALVSGVTLPNIYGTGSTTYEFDTIDYRIAKFKYEFQDHFNYNNILSYYLISEIFGFVDQRAKNMFLTSWGNEGSGYYKWYMMFYDNDTCLGINNEGVNQFNYNIEYHDVIGTQNVWNGSTSALWTSLELAFKNELETMYYNFRTSGALSYDSIMEMLNIEQSSKWSEGIYNQDAQYKYIDPLIEQNISTYLYQVQGSRMEHRKWWVSNRFNYIDSKYNAGDYRSDFLTMRIYTPSEWVGIEPNADFIFVPYIDQYLRVKYGSYETVGVRTTKNTPTIVSAPTGSTFNDTETIIYGCSHIKNIGSLASKYPGTVDATFAVKLEELIIGSDVSGYSNTNLTTLSLGNNTLLRKLDVQNCPNLVQPIDVSNCTGIEEIYAQGTSSTSIKLGIGGILRKIYYPNTITNLTIMNQPSLTDEYFSLPSVDVLSTVRIENVPGINTLSIIENCFAITGDTVLDRVRLVGIDWELENDDLMYQLLTINGLDENGNNIQYPYLSGNIKINSEMTLTDYDIITTAFPNVIFDIPNLLDYTITISGSTVLDVIGTYNVVYNDVDFGVYETERKTIDWTKVLNGEYVDMVVSEDKQSAIISIASGATENPMSGVGIKIVSEYNTGKTNTKYITLSGFISGLTITGQTTISEGTSSTYGVIFEPSNTNQTSIVWSLDSGSEFATINSSTGLVTITDNYITGDTNFIIRATSVNNSSIYNTKTVTAQKAYNRTFNITNVGGTIPTNAYVLLDTEVNKRYADEYGVVVIRNRNSISGIVGGDKSSSKTFNYGSVSADTTYNIELDKSLEVTSLNDLVLLRNGINSGTTFDYNGDSIPAYGVGCTFTLTNNIDLSTVCGSGIGSWTPIGNSDTKKFQGNFNGGNFTISNLYIDQIGVSSNKGLFGYAVNSKISNLKLSNVYVTSSQASGGIISEMSENVIMENCHILSGYLSAQYSFCGGIVGYVKDNCIVKYCTNYATIYGYQNHNGGIVGNIGSVNSGTTVEYCINYGLITGDSSYDGSSGIVGSAICIQQNPQIYVKYCLNSANIDFTNNNGNNIGCIVGNSFYTKISYCLNIGEFTVSNNSSYYGTIAGGGSAPSDYRNTLYNYYDNELSSIGGYNNVDYTGYCEGKTTSNLKGTSLRTGSSGPGWTDENWVFVDGEYPTPKML